MALDCTRTTDGIDWGEGRYTRMTPYAGNSWVAGSRRRRTDDGFILPQSSGPTVSLGGAMPFRSRTFFTFLVTGRMP